MKDLEQEIVDNDEIIKILKEKNFLIKEERYNNDSNKDLKKDYPEKTKNIKEALLKYVGENDFKL